MARRDANAHPDDAELSGLLDDAAAPDASSAAHVAMCERCTGRLTELRGLRNLLRAAGTQAVQPPSDLTSRVIQRLRLRNSAVSSVNEVFAAMLAVLSGISTFLGGKPPANAVKKPGSGVPRG